MLFTWDTTNLCIVFHGWRITNTGSLIVSLLAIVLMTAGYEAVREASRRYEAYANTIGERRGGDDLRGESLRISYAFGGGHKRMSLGTHGRSSFLDLNTSENNS
jgi:hypothetical protein